MKCQKGLKSNFCVEYDDDIEYIAETMLIHQDIIKDKVIGILIREVNAK